MALASPPGGIGVMTEKRVSDTQVFTLGPGDALTVAVLIGDGQPGGSAVLLGGEPVPFTDQQEPLVIVRVRTPTVLDFVTYVEDRNALTNRTSVTYELGAGGTTRAYRYALEATENGLVRYEISFLLVGR
jgi:hypothetical protein